MRRDLDHLPSNKQLELRRAVAVLLEEFEDALRLGQTKAKKQGRILKVVLFGSYARGDWVEDRKSGYASDYDLLVVVNHEELTDLATYWGRADERLLREVTVTGRLSAPVNFIVHSLSDVNDQLIRGRYFFTDLVAQGIVLYEADETGFARPEPLGEDAARAEAQGFYDHWFPSIGGFVRGAGYALRDGDLNKAAFDLHQATERLYVCMLLVLTLYAPKSHKLNFLRSQAERLVPELIAAWPRATREDRRRFELLRRAYVEARYSSAYSITADELAWLGERVRNLQEAVQRICTAKLALAITDGAL
jgi:predicted nucleotidyltransferase/HEPN domain-containing protein